MVSFGKQTKCTKRTKRSSCPLVLCSKPHSRIADFVKIFHEWDFLFRQGLVLLDDLLRTVLHYLASEPAEAGVGWKHSLVVITRIQEVKLRYKSYKSYKSYKEDSWETQPLTGLALCIDVPQLVSTEQRRRARSQVPMHVDDELCTRHPLTFKIHCISLFNLRKLEVVGEVLPRYDVAEAIPSRHDCIPDHLHLEDLQLQWMPLSYGVDQIVSKCFGNACDSKGALRSCFSLCAMFGQAPFCAAMAIAWS